MGKFANELMKYIGKSVIGALGQSMYNRLLYSNFLTRPIGLVSRSYKIMEDTLSRNIGSGIHDFDGYGTNIGNLSDPELNSRYAPWFYVDEEKNSHQDYIDYINDVYFNSDGIVANFSSDELKASFFDFSSLNLDNAKVGAVRSYDIDDNDAAQHLVPSNQVNSNDVVSDTRLGIINNFYLNATMMNAKNVYEENSSAYAEPTYGDKSLLKEEGFGITQGVYSKFGLDGEYGIVNGIYRENKGMVRNQKELTGDIIPWSTIDHVYNTSEVVGKNGNIDLVKTLLDTNSNNIDTTFMDVAQDTEMSNLYYPFGNFYSITYSLGLTQTSGSKTQKFIAKSMYGFDLMDDKFDSLATFDYKDGDGKVSAVKKYYAGQGTRGTNYIDAMTAIDVQWVKDENNRVIRMNLIDAGNDNLWSTKALYAYAEAEGAEGKGSPLNGAGTIQTYNNGSNYGKVVAYTTQVTGEKEDIINYTNRRFILGQYDTLIGRFHTNSLGSPTEARASRDLLTTAISQYGMSHGRNLLRKNRGENNKGTDGEGYDNPYCRVWTYHHQYSTINNLIRPLLVNGDSLETSDIGKGRPGQRMLEKYGVKSGNGFVRFAPTSSDNITKCMFSLENLAWKYDDNLGKEKRGPNRGRIMWFPPYDLKFSENVNVNWSSNSFIGRGEQIYTYTNTERSGNLSFKLLIDHPNVINSWRGDVRGGDGIGDVDDTESNEQKILRFFAGCEILEGGKRENKTPDKAHPPKIEEPKPQDVELPTTTYESAYFFVFFPNNYSGKGDTADGAVKPMVYLANGIGTQRGYTQADISGMSESQLYQYEQVNHDNLPTTTDYNYYIGGVEKIGGYEMRDMSNGISNTDSYSDNKLRLFNATINGQTIIAQTDKQKGKNGSWIYWAYRCDKAYNNEIMHIPQGKRSNVTNYFDFSSYGLNSQKGYKLLYGTNGHTKAKEWDENGELYSFADVFYAMDDATKIFEADLYSEERVASFRRLVEEYDIAEIKINGFASSHGYSKNNEELSQNRAKSVRDWLVAKNKKFGDAKFIVGANEKSPNLTHHDNNQFDAKLWRCSRVEIKFQKEDIVAPQENVPTVGVENENVGVERISVDNVNHYDNETARGNQEAVDAAKASKATTTQAVSDYMGKKLTHTQQVATYNTQEYNRAMSDAQVMEANSMGQLGTVNPYNGYGNEYEYFSDLKENDPFLHNKIVEKIKYFDPAYHSITPEGFNSRLTFLHQCTRQGSTVGASDTGGTINAVNLAFGAPPVCVLRIGDFYHTRIIIESLSIDYDDGLWDLNDEGIGVMPMMANITIGFKFIGGSDLAGPIKRLQNAVSFNYYANTSVYDDRADVFMGQQEQETKKEEID